MSLFFTISIVCERIHSPLSKKSLSKEIQSSFSLHFNTKKKAPLTHSQKSLNTLSSFSLSLHIFRTKVHLLSFIGDVFSFFVSTSIIQNMYSTALSVIYTLVYRKSTEVKNSPLVYILLLIC